MLPDDRDPWVRGMMVGGRSSSIDILDENGDFRSISRDAIVEVQTRHASEENLHRGRRVTEIREG